MEQNSAHCKSIRDVEEDKTQKGRKELVWSFGKPTSCPVISCCFVRSGNLLVLALCMEPRTNKRSRGENKSQSFGLALAWLWLGFGLAFVLGGGENDKQTGEGVVLGAAPRRRTERGKRLCLVDQERGKRRKSAHTQSSRGRGELDIERRGSVRRLIASGRGRV